jgi:demethylmenaquinone methyltransferase/2-methoxy-6-polyprenyl-1,4-benzoquinol methylase
MFILMPAPDHPLPPHHLLDRDYPTEVGRRAYLRNVFDSTASEYDKVETMLSFGSGRWYRRQALRRAGLRPGMKVLDVAMGTGLVTREALAAAGQGNVIGLDPSLGMISQARASLKLDVVVGVGEALPFEDRQFDFLSMGYALRHLPDLRRAFAEFYRVLRPGGRLCILEITRPEGRLRRTLFSGYMRHVLPTIARLGGSRRQTRQLWHYYGETIDHCVAPQAILATLSEIGFRRVNRYVSLGIFSEYTAVKE